MAWQDLTYKEFVLDYTTKEVQIGGYKFVDYEWADDDRTYCIRHMAYKPMTFEKLKKIAGRLTLVANACDLNHMFVTLK